MKIENRLTNQWTDYLNITFILVIALIGMSLTPRIFLRLAKVNFRKLFARCPKLIPQKVSAWLNPLIYNHLEPVWNDKHPISRYACYISMVLQCDQNSIQVRTQFNFRNFKVILCKNFIKKSMLRFYIMKFWIFLL